MSVLKNKRTVSAAEYVNTANLIFEETMAFTTRLSARYARILADDTIKLAGEVLDHAEKANKIFPSDEERRSLRKAHLLEALGSLSALDVRLTHCYIAMNRNPNGCFTTTKGAELKPGEAISRLDKMADKLGNLIDYEDALLKKVLESDARRKNR